MVGGMMPLVRCAAAALVLVVSAGAAEFRFGEQTLRVPDGFTIERVAGPPLVDRPIVADFDETGNLYVADSSGSNDPVKKQLEEKPHRIVRLTDSDGDGVFDKRTVFADRMMFPEGAMWLEGSLYVSAPPSIWKLTDVDGDGVAEKREEWFDAKTLTGCANDLHGPYLGLDGWVYWCKGAFAEQTYERPSGKPFVTRAAHIFRRRPEGGLVEPVMTGGMDNPVDVTFTAEGERVFTTTFFQHPGGGQRDGLIHAIYGGVYGKVHDVIDDHRKTGELMPVLTHLGPAAPAGLTRYESGVFGEDHRNNLFAALFNLQKVTRHVLEPNGATFRAVNSDFVSSEHHDFHPTDVIEDADGSLLVIDTGGWYKICCPTSQLWKPDVLGAIYRVRKTGAPKVEDPRGLKADWSGSAARLLGDPRPAVARRAVQTVRKQNSPESLRKMVSESKWVELRRNAVWALAGMQSEEKGPVLRLALKDKEASVRQAAVHAVSVNRVRAAAPELAALLADESLAVRRAAAEALGRCGDKGSAGALMAAAAELKAASGSTLPDRVQEHSIIFALIELNAAEETAKGLASGNVFARRAAMIALDQMGSPLLTAAETVGLANSKDPVLKQTANWIVSHRQEWAGELARVFAERLAAVELGGAEEQELQQQLANFASRAAPSAVLAGAANPRQGDLAPERRRIAIRAMRSANLKKEAPESWAAPLIASMREPKSPLAAEAVETAAALAFGKGGRPAELGDELGKAAANGALPLETRLRALGAVTAGRELDSQQYDLALNAVAKPFPASAAAASILAKAKLSEEQLRMLAERLKGFGPIELSAVLPAFEHAPSERVGAELIESLKQARGLAGVHADRARQLFAKYPERVQEQAKALYDLLNEDAAKQAARLEELLPKLKDGDVRRGQAIFNSERAACATCHAIGYLGGNLGPDLTRIGQVRTERDLLEAIVFPSASFVRSYEPLVVATRGGEDYSGVVRRDAADELVLATGPGVEVRIARSDVAELRPGKLSVMPQGLDEQLSTQELADLMAFLKATRW